MARAPRKPLTIGGQPIASSTKKSTTTFSRGRAEKNESVVKFQALMAQLPKSISAPIERAVLDQALFLVQDMRLAAPREEGDLEASIRVEPSPRTRFRKLVKAGGPKTTRGGYDYANAQEFGTEKHKAQPYFWPTYRAERRGIRRRIREAMFKAIAEHVVLKR